MSGGEATAGHARHGAFGRRRAARAKRPGSPGTRRVGASRLLPYGTRLVGADRVGGPRRGGDGQARRVEPEPRRADRASCRWPRWLAASVGFSRRGDATLTWKRSEVESSSAHQKRLCGCIAALRRQQARFRGDYRRHPASGGVRRVPQCDRKRTHLPPQRGRVRPPNRLLRPHRHLRVPTSH